MLVNFLELNSKANASKFRERKRKVLSSVHAVDKTWNWEHSRCSRAATVKKCTKSMMHVQSCCFVSPNLLLFCRSRCFRRRRCLSSLISGSNCPSEIACVAGVRKERGRNLGRETTRAPSRFSHAWNSLSLPFQTPATQANLKRWSCFPGRKCSKRKFAALFPSCPRRIWICCHQRPLSF